MERQKKWSRFCLQCGIVEAKYEWQRHSVSCILYLYWSLLPTIQPRYQLLGRLTTRISAITISIIHLRLASGSHVWFTRCWWWTTEWRAWGTPSTPCWWSCTSWPWWAWSAAASATAAASCGTCTWRSGRGLCWDKIWGLGIEIISLFYDALMHSCGVENNKPLKSWA